MSDMAAPDPRTGARYGDDPPPRPVLPEPAILANGDVLVPSADFTQMVRLPVGHPQHAEWMVRIQGEQRGQGIGASVAASLFIPILGVMIAIWYFSKGRANAGWATLLASVLGFVVGLVLLQALASSGF